MLLAHLFTATSIQLTCHLIHKNYMILFLTFAFGHLLLSFVKLAANISLTLLFLQSNAAWPANTTGGTFSSQTAVWGHQGLWSKSSPSPQPVVGVLPPRPLPQSFSTQRPLGMKSPTVDWNSAWRQGGPTTGFWILNPSTQNRDILHELLVR